MTEETKKRFRRSPDEIAKDLRARADRTERAGRLAALRADPTAALVHAAYDVLSEAALRTQGDVQLEIEAARAECASALLKLGHDVEKL